MDYDDMLADWDSNYQQDMAQARGTAEQTPSLAHDGPIATSVEVNNSADEVTPEFTAREWARLRFLRELVHSGKLSEWDLSPADRAAR